jgi:sugar (pentulose or hexulose) kinase
MESCLFAGLDVSTQSCKLVVLDWTARTTVYVDAVHYDRDLPQWKAAHPNPIPLCGWRPLTWYSID